MQENQILLVRNIFSNIGDEAMLCCEIEEIRHAFPTFRLKILTDNPPRISRLYRIETDFSDTVLTTPFAKESNRIVHHNLLKNEESLINNLNQHISGLTTRFMLPKMCRRFVQSVDEKNKIRLPEHQQKLLDNLKSARLVIGGGGLIPSIKGIFLPKVALYQSLSALGVPYILHGQTVLPENGAEQVYQNAIKVLLRDRDLSKQTALKFGADAERLVEKLDPAFDLPVGHEKLLDSETLQFLEKPFLAVNLREWKTKNFTALFSNLAEAINKFQRLFPETRIVFFPMQNYGTDKDLTAINKLKCQLSPEIKTLTLSADLRPAVLKSVLAKSFLTITSRYHGAVFGLSAAVPTIGISVSAEYDVKLNGVFSMFEADEFLFSADKSDAEQIFGLLNQISDNRSGIISNLQKQKEKLQNLPSLSDVLTEVLRDEKYYARSQR